jgi:hypothetical protein
VDTSFLVGRYLRPSTITNAAEQTHIRKSQEWWGEIDAQLKVDRAKVYVPALCIAEAFKVLAKKYYDDKIFKKPIDYKHARDRLRADIHLTTKKAVKPKRRILFHDIETSRDVIIGVDRFYEQAHKLKVSVGIVDLLLLATAKYLTDFYGFTDDELFVVTMDNGLYKLGRKIRDIPMTFNPLRTLDAASQIFV